MYDESAWYASTACQSPSTNSRNRRRSVVRIILVPIPKLVPRLPEIIAGRGHCAWSLSAYTGAPAKVVDTVGTRQFDPERDRTAGFVRPGPTFHAQSLGGAHLDQGACIFGS